MTADEAASGPWPAPIQYVQPDTTPENLGEAHAGQQAHPLVMAPPGTDLGRHRQPSPREDEMPPGSGHVMSIRRRGTQRHGPRTPGHGRILRGHAQVRERGPAAHTRSRVRQRHLPATAHLPNTVRQDERRPPVPIGNRSGALLPRQARLADLEASAAIITGTVGYTWSDAPLDEAQLT